MSVFHVWCIVEYDTSRILCQGQDIILRVRLDQSLDRVSGGLKSLAKAVDK